VDFYRLYETGNFGREKEKKLTGGLLGTRSSVIEGVCDRINNLLAKSAISGESKRDA